MEKLTRRKFMELTGAAAVVAGTSSLTGCAMPAMPEEIICERGEEIEIENGKMIVLKAVDAEDIDSIVVGVWMAFEPSDGEIISLRARDFRLELNGENIETKSLYVDKLPGLFRDEKVYNVTDVKKIAILGEAPKEMWKEDNAQNFLDVRFIYKKKCYLVKLGGPDGWEGFSGS